MIAYAFISIDCMWLDRLIDGILKWFWEKKLKKKILSYKEKYEDGKREKSKWRRKVH